jgi:hypothetical protein
MISERKMVRNDFILWNKELGRQAGTKLSWKI